MASSSREIVFATHLQAWNTVGLDEKGAIVLREKVSRGRIAALLAQRGHSLPRS
jgi:hypothetical protein